MLSASAIESFIQTLDNTCLCESFSNLKLYHYSGCTDSDSTELKNLRGVVVDSNGGVVARSFPFTPEYVIGENTSEQYPLTFDDQTRFYKSYEGTIIRVFHHSNKWYVSTHHKLDAYASRWGNVHDFGTEFQFIIENITSMPMTCYFESKLQKDRTHVFLLRTSIMSRIVSMPPANTSEYVYYVGAFTADSYIFPDNETVPWYTPERLYFNSSSELENYVRLLNTDIQGVFAVTSDNRFYKFVGEKYRQLALVRGNEPNILIRYITLKNTNENDATALRGMNPEHSGMFQFVDDRMKELATFIKTTYTMRYVNKCYTPVPKVIYPFQKQLHSHYLENRKPITLGFITAKLNNTDSKWIAKMIHTDLTIPPPDLERPATTHPNMEVVV